MILLTNGKIIAMVEMFRHGARAPLTSYDKVAEMFFPYKDGELTTLGMEQLYLLGKYMREKYDEIIEANGRNVKLFSMDMPRAINSGINHFSAMFPEFVFNFQYLPGEYFKYGEVINQQFALLVISLIMLKLAQIKIINMIKI
jgi:hypothetical protein